MIITFHRGSPSRSSFVGDPELPRTPQLSPKEAETSAPKRQGHLPDTIKLKDVADFVAGL